MLSKNAQSQSIKLSRILHKRKRKHFIRGTHLYDLVLIIKILDFLALSEKTILDFGISCGIY